MKKTVDGLRTRAYNGIPMQTNEIIVDKNDTGSSENPSEAERLQALLDEAMKHPGVADVLKIYSTFQEADKEQAAYRFFQTPFYHESVSTSAEPVLN